MNKQFMIAIITICIISTYTFFQIGSPAPIQGAAISYARDVRPILETRCARCHMGTFTSAGLHMDSYEKLMAGSENGPVVVPGDAHQSLLVQKILDGEMPKRGPKLTPAEVQVIIDWINAGANQN